MNRRISWMLAAGLAFAGLSAASAGSEINAYVKLKGSEVSVTLSGDYSNATLTVSGPGDYYARSYSKTGSPSVDLIKTGGTADGVYSYEVSAATSQTVTVTNPLDNGRGGTDPATQQVSATTSGNFVAKGGLIVETDTAAAAEERE